MVIGTVVRLFGMEREDREGEGVVWEIACYEFRFRRLLGMVVEVRTAAWNTWKVP